MAIAAVLPLSVSLVASSITENCAFHRSYSRQAFVNNKFLRSRPKLIERNQPAQCLNVQKLITKASITRDLVIDEQSANDAKNGIEVVSIHHVGLLCSNLEKSLAFYQGLLGLEVNEARPNDKLPYGGKWLWVGSEMIHLMELPNPDPITGRPEHGGRDRHVCIAIKNVNKLKSIFDEGAPGIGYYTFTHSTKRNKLTSKKVEDLVHVHSNLRILSHKSEGYTRGPNKLWDIHLEASDFVSSAAILAQISLLRIDDDNPRSSTQGMDHGASGSGVANGIHGDDYEEKLDDIL